MVSGAGLVDEVYYDERGQTAVVSDEFGTVTTFEASESAHYLIDGASGAKVAAVDHGIPASWCMSTDAGSSLTVHLDVRRVRERRVQRAIAARTVVEPSFRPEPVDGLGDFKTMATGSHSKTMWQYITAPTGACITAWNSRNNSSGYFVASSASLNTTTCRYVGTSLWKAPGTGSCTSPWVGSSGTHYNYADKSVFNKYPTLSAEQLHVF